MGSGAYCSVKSIEWAPTNDVIYVQLANIDDGCDGATAAFVYQVGVSLLWKCELTAGQLSLLHATAAHILVYMTTAFVADF
jgi:hypothetical protein